MIEATRIGFDPWFGWPVLWIAIGVAVAGWLAYLFWRGRAWLTRGLALSVLALALANPSIIEEERDPLPSVAALILDRSESMTFSNRQEVSEAVFASLREQIVAEDGLELRILESDPRADSTRLATSLQALMADVPRDRIAGAILVTDGQIHDLPEEEDMGRLAEYGPVHSVVVGDSDDGDRRIAIISGPSFDIVGEEADFVIRANDPNADRVPVRATLNGETVTVTTIPTGRDVPLPVKIDRRGPNVLVVETPEGTEELTLANNRTAATVTGVRDRLRVLLITGQPHAGARVWRDLLKSDPQVDLVQFVILRPPTKTDATPLEELALIGFPTQELFEEKLGDFDLIIFDQYERRGVIQFSYLSNMARYVDEGGALFVGAGKPFASGASLYRPALAAVLPIRPTGEIIETETLAELTDTGRRHTVTAPLGDEEWGPWYRYIEGEAETGDVLIQAPDGSPILALDRIGEGRVGQLMTDQLWLWSRDHEGGGPFAELIRRSVHWLMGEPELEERKLEISASGEMIELALYILDESPAAVTVETPSGESRTPSWQRDANGVYRTSIPSEGLGLYRATAGELQAVVLNGPANPEEYANLSVSTERVDPLAEATDGGVIRLERAGSGPDIRLVSERGRAAGDSWLGLRERGAYAVTSSRSTALLPGWLGVVLVLVLLMLAWRREGR